MFKTDEDPVSVGPGSSDRFRAHSLRLQEMQRPGRLWRLRQRLRLCDRRNMLWSWTPGEPRNFGDWIGPLLFLERQGRIPVFCKLGAGSNAHAYLAAGSILGQVKRPDAAVVWGAGVMRRDQTFERPREIRAVRGPLTRRRCLELGYDCPEVFGDPAILLPSLFGKPEVETTTQLGIIPHFVHLAAARTIFGDSERIRIIDVTRPISEVVAGIRSCGLTVSSSLHGLIVSHAYGILSAWVAFDQPLRGDGVKFHDYFLSAGVDPPAPARITQVVPIEDLVDLARASPLPRLEPLHKRLWDACPF